MPAARSSLALLALLWSCALGLALAQTQSDNLQRATLSGDLSDALSEGAPSGPSASTVPAPTTTTTAAATTAGCDCSCRAVDTATGLTAPKEDLVTQKAQLACSTCCEEGELLEAMTPYLPTKNRVTAGGQSCNEPSGFLSIFLQPTCWQAPKAAKCEFPFIVGYNQVVVDCTRHNDNKEWCVYDMEAWNTRGAGWGYCAPATQEETASAPSSAGSPANSTANGSTENLDTIISNLTKIQGEELKAYEANLYEDVTNSGGLTPAGIGVVVAVCVLIVGILVGAGFVIWKLRSRIKQRRQQTFHQMDSGKQGEVAMNSL